jgi:hypothetical protein
MQVLSEIVVFQHLMKQKIANMDLYPTFLLKRNKANPTQGIRIRKHQQNTINGKNPFQANKRY